MIAVLIFMSVFHIATPIVRYRYGLTLSEPWLSLSYCLPILFLFSLGLILILFVRLIILNIRFGIKRFLLQMAFIIVAIVCLVRLIDTENKPSFLQGFCDNMKANADIDAIQDWLDSLEWDSLERDFYLPPESWPDAINILPHSPSRNVYLLYSTNNKRYVGVRYGGGAVTINSWSLVVGVGADEIPLDDYFETEERLELAPNAFVGYARKHN